MTKGIIYYNSGMSCIIRMIVSLYSLRKVYDGPVTIFYPKRDEVENSFSIKLYNYMKDIFKCNIQKIDLDVPKGKNRIFLERTKYHTVTPYDVSMSIDSDTIVLSPKIVDYLSEAETNSFSIAKFSDWKTQGRNISLRIKYWKTHYPDMIKKALDFGSAINCGCFAFTRDSDIMQVWYDTSVVGRESFICDETCMQLLLPLYKHSLLPSRYNTSCKYDKNINEEGYPIVIHYHGKKHCRFTPDGEPENNCGYWLYFLSECYKNGIFDRMNLDIRKEAYEDKMYNENLKFIKKYL